MIPFTPTYTHIAYRYCLNWFIIPLNKIVKKYVCNNRALLLLNNKKVSAVFGDPQTSFSNKPSNKTYKEHTEGLLW